MAIINRDISGGSKKFTRTTNFSSGLATGVTNVLVQVPYDAILKGVNVSAFGLSGAPVWSLSVLRFAGGQTALAIGATLTLTAYGTSGCIGFSLTPPGFSLAAGDLVLLTSGGANAAVASATVAAVYQGTADIKVYQNTIG